MLLRARSARLPTLMRGILRDPQVREATTLFRFLQPGIPVPTEQRERALEQLIELAQRSRQRDSS